MRSALCCERIPCRDSISPARIKWWLRNDGFTLWFRISKTFVSLRFEHRLGRVCRSKQSQAAMNKTNMMLFTLFCFPFLGGYLFAALIIAYTTTCQNSPSYNLVPDNLYLQIGGIAFIVTSLITICTGFTICENKDYEHYERTTTGQSFMLWIAITLQLMWAIVGCFVYG